MSENFVTQEQLNRLDERLERIRTVGFSYYSGRALEGLVNLTSTLVGITAITGALVYGAMTCAYGPYDAGKIIYSASSGDESLKHRHVETAKALYARRLQKQELDERDMKNLFIELGVVSDCDKKPTEEDVSWYGLLSWIEDND